MTQLPPSRPQPRVTLHHGDALDVLRAIPDASIDAVITDPPYGLAEHRPATILAAMTAWASGDRDHVPDGKGFMGRAWDGFVPPPAVWDECLRVLKPGGHLLCFAGTRTVDLMGLSVRLAGFEIRDTITWHYGSGFPKSRDVSKDLDRMAGAEREIVGAVDRPKFSKGRGHGRDANGAPAYRGVNGGHDGTASLDITAPATDAARQWQGWGTALKPASEPIIVARKPLTGTVAANVQAHGTGALNVDACRVEAQGRPLIVSKSETSAGVFGDGLNGSAHGGVTDQGRWPANVVLTHGADCNGECVDGCPVAELDAQAPNAGGNSVGADPARYLRGNEVYGEDNRAAAPFNHPGGKGGASRFFPTFRYQAKAPTRERPKVDGIAHPTVKPLALMAWLVRLVCPPGGTVLDPFAGSGTTLQAALGEGFAAVGIEREATYLPLIAHRLGLELVDLLAEEIPTSNMPADMPAPEPEPEPPTDPILAAILATPPKRHLLLRIRDRHMADWTDAHTAAAKARLDNRTRSVTPTQCDPSLVVGR